MGAESGEKSRSVRLTTWKEIAKFLGRDERTVKRWEATRGLPVRRVPGSGKSSVFAYAHELQAWLDGGVDKQSPVATPPPVIASSSLRWAALAVAVLIVGTAALLWMRHPTVTPEGGTRDVVAAEQYRAGLHAWQTRSPSGLARAVEDFNAAIRRDPNYAQAYVGLANSFNLMREFTLMPADVAYAKAAAAAARAVTLAPSLAGAHAALAFADFYGRRDIAGARREFSRAITLDANDPIAHHWYATFLMTIGDFDAARVQIDRAAQLDPESAAILADKALILFYAGDAREAVTLLKQLETDQPLFASPHYYLSAIALTQGDDALYLRELKLMADARHDAQSAALAADGAEGLAKGGHEGMLQALLAGRLTLYARGRETAYGLAQTYAELGQRDQALAYLQISLERREPDLVGLKINPLFSGLHGTPGFSQLLTRTGLGV